MVGSSCQRGGCYVNSADVARIWPMDAHAAERVFVGDRGLNLLELDELQSFSCNSSLFVLVSES